MAERVVKDYKELKKYIDAHKDLNHAIVCTIGSWDMLHIGHVRYLMEAKKHGDILIVGTDSDRALKLYKGDERPIIPEEERMEMLSYQQCVDFVTIVDDVDSDGKWQYELIKTIKPHFFVAVEDSYPQEQLDDIKKHCDDVVVLPRQATTSTSGTIEKAVKIRGSKVLTRLKETISEVEKMLSNES